MALNPSNRNSPLYDLPLPDWMQFGFQSMRVPDEYWKYFPEYIRHRFELADALAAMPTSDNMPIDLRRYIRRYLITKGVLPSGARLRTKLDGSLGANLELCAEYLGHHFIQRVFTEPSVRPRDSWVSTIRAHRAPLEFAQSEAIGNIWPEALIQRMYDEYNYGQGGDSGLFAPELTPEGKALEAYENECAAVREANEALDRFLNYLKKNVSRRPIRPMIIVRQFAVAPTEHDGLGWEQQRYDHTLYPRLEAYFGPRAWAFISSHYDKETRKHKTIHQQALVRHLDEDRPVTPSMPEQVKASVKPVVYDDYGQLIDVRFDQTLGCWVDDFGDPVERIDEDVQAQG